MQLFIHKKITAMKTVAILLSLVVLFAVSCAKSELETQHVSATPCKQDVLRSSDLSDKVDVEFTNKGVQITHYNFEVPCDFTTVNVTHTFVNGVLRITQQGLPNQANCVCHSDVSYTIEGISQNEVNVIFINGVQIYCHNENFPIEIPFTEYLLTETSCKWTNFESNKVIIINSDEKIRDYIVCADDDYSKIDFTKYSLLLAKGGATSGIRYIDIDFFKEETNKYTLNVNIHTDMTAVAPGWLISIVVPKINNKATITLNAQQIND